MGQVVDSGQAILVDLLSNQAGMALLRHCGEDHRCASSNAANASHVGRLSSTCSRRSTRAAQDSSIHSGTFNAEPSGWRTVTDRWAWRGQASTSSDCRLSGWNG